MTHSIEIFDAVTNRWCKSSIKCSSWLEARNTAGRSFGHELLAQRLDGIERVRIIGPAPTGNEVRELLESVL